MIENAEKLIILTDLANGILNRLYLLINYEDDEVFNNEIHKYIQALSKKNFQYLKIV